VSSHAPSSFTSHEAALFVDDGWGSGDVDVDADGWPTEADFSEPEHGHSCPGSVYPLSRASCSSVIAAISNRNGTINTSVSFQILMYLFICFRATLTQKKTG
jgi:hypothetical protein